MENSIIDKKVKYPEYFNNSSFKDISTIIIDENSLISIFNSPIEYEKYKNYLYSDYFLNRIKKIQKDDLYFTDALEGHDISKVKPPTLYNFLCFLVDNNIDITFRNNNLNLSFDKLKHQPILYFFNKNFSKINFEKPNYIDKKFIYLNGTNKNHRITFFNKMKKNKILDDCYYSINAYNQELSNGFSKIESKTINIVNELTYSDLIEEYFKSAINIITETYFYQNGKYTFLTEKLTKSLIVKQPFIILGTFNYLKTLKQLGFKTFDKWWDESYDDEYDNHKRLNMVFDLVKNISKLNLNDIITIRNEMEDILNHNFELYQYYCMNNNVNTISDEFLNIIEFIQNNDTHLLKERII